ncbi:hypothetical protein ACQY0O_001446 [Thecaphora frezii]
MPRSTHSQDDSGQRRYASSPSAPRALASFGSRSVVSQPAAAYDSNAALLTSQMHGYSDVAHPDAMRQGS